MKKKINSLRNINNYDMFFKHKTEFLYMGKINQKI